MNKAFTLAALGVLSLVSANARATGFTDAGQDFHARPKTEVKLDGAFRTRGEVLQNLDLDRGLTPSGEALWFVPEGNPTSQTFTYADMRLRTDLTVYTAGGAVAVKSRIDVLDNVPLGGNAVGIPSASSTQRTQASDAFRIKRAYGEVWLPFGLLAAGRMGNHWGLGMLANGGDCADCDSGDAQDRVALITPLLGHIIAFAYDFSWIGPQAYRKDSVRRIGIAPATGVQTVTFAILRYNDDLAHTRRRAAGKITVNYGAYMSHRRQSSDAPYEYLSIAQGARPTGTPIQTRGATATAIDAWLRIIFPHARIEAEIAYLVGRVEQPSLIPGVSSNQPVTSNQLGAAVQSELGAPHDPYGAGFDFGYASGDSAPGFGAFVDQNSPVARKGDFEGAQANLPYDRTVDNFRFHPDYRVDRILFREILGTITDTTYVRPHARIDLMRIASGRLVASIAGIASWAVKAASTPSGSAPLGVEIDPTLAWWGKDGFGFALEHAVFFPGSAFDNPQARLPAKPAQLIRLRLTYAF